MNLEELLTKLETPIVIRPTRRMTQRELETYLDKAADILRGNADHSEFRGYVFALLFYKRISDCYEEEVRTQADALVKAGVPRDQALLLARDPQTHHFTVPENDAWGDVARTAKGQLGQKLNEAMLSIERANAHRQNNFDGILTSAARVSRTRRLTCASLAAVLSQRRACVASLRVQRRRRRTPRYGELRHANAARVR